MNHVGHTPGNKDMCMHAKSIKNNIGCSIVRRRCCVRLKKHVSHTHGN